MLLGRVNVQLSRAHMNTLTQTSKPSQEDWSFKRLLMEMKDEIIEVVFTEEKKRVSIVSIISTFYYPLPPPVLTIVIHTSRWFICLHGLNALGDQTHGMDRGHAR